MLALYISLLDTEEQISKFEHIYTKYRGLMFYTAKGVLQDSYLAEDAVHETFLDIIRIIDSIRANNEKELSQFLRVLTHHKAVDMVRKCTRQKKSDTEIEDLDLSKSDVNVETIVLDKIDYENNCFTVFYGTILVIAQNIHILTCCHILQLIVVVKFVCHL